MIVFEGHLYKEGKFWLVEIPALNLMTQAFTKRQAYKMAKSLIQDASGQTELKLNLIQMDDLAFLIQSDDLEALIPLLLKKQRQKQLMQS